MGSVDRRLERLEDLSRESAAAEVRAGWRVLSDEEMALVVAPYYHGRAPTPRERAAEVRANRKAPSGGTASPPLLAPSNFTAPPGPNSHNTTVRLP